MDKNTTTTITMAQREEEEEKEEEEEVLDTCNLVLGTRLSSNEYLIPTIILGKPSLSTSNWHPTQVHRCPPNLGQISISTDPSGIV